LVIVSGLVFQSQSSSTPLTSLFISPEQLAWQLQVTGLVRHDLNLTVEDLLQMPQTSVDAAIYCLPSPEARQGYFHEGGNWTGVQLRALLNQASLLPTTQKLAFYASDGFTTDLSIDVALAENVIIAYAKDGRPLRQHLRVVVPGRWGYKWIHSLLRIEAVDYDYLGRYEQNGFPDDAINTTHP
jgi:DMSO/TMAO reductase YedYZ molybdopterin-dependent catalytic subunit